MDDATFNRGFPRFTHFPHPRLEILRLWVCLSCAKTYYFNRHHLVIAGLVVGLNNGRAFSDASPMRKPYSQNSPRLRKNRSALCNRRVGLPWCRTSVQRIIAGTRRNCAINREDANQGGSLVFACGGPIVMVRPQRWHRWTTVSPVLVACIAT